MQTHTQEYFYKYLTTNAGIATLQNMTTKWSSPLLFNDPWDMQMKMQFSFSYDELKDAITKELEQLVYQDEEPIFINHHLYFPMIVKLLRKNKHRIPKDQIIEQSKLGLDEGTINSQKILEDLNGIWKEEVRDSRVFCVSEDCENRLMWTHYADEYRGIVIKFKCLPEFDTALCAAEKIMYTSSAPTIDFSLEDYVKEMTGQSDKKKNIAHEYTYTKSDDWAYEKEWRCRAKVHPDRGNVEDLFDFSKILPQEIDSVFFGFKISEENKQIFLDLLSHSDFNHVKIFITSKNFDSFCHEHEQIR